MVYKALSPTMVPNGTTGRLDEQYKSPLLSASGYLTASSPAPAGGDVSFARDNHLGAATVAGMIAGGVDYRHPDFRGNDPFGLGGEADDAYGTDSAEMPGFVKEAGTAATGNAPPSERSVAFLDVPAADSAVGAPQTAYNDPSVSAYWHLQATISVAGGANVVNVWDDYRGAGVVVGVIDDGVDYTHPDLAANYAFALDYDARDLDFDAYPSDSTDRHGTTVAGVIAAALDNGEGGAGVAPEATLAGYRIGFGANGSYQQILSAFQWMASIDVANNSWSFDGFLGDSFLDPGFAPIGVALDTALATGRGGLGPVVVFSAGNGRTDGQDVNYHNMQNSRGTIAVAATDSAGNVTWFSTPGAALLVAAPGQSLPTTDRVGAPGYSSGDYATMSGTSFSAPLVSGIAALMLDANPGLGWRDVQEILASTAVQTGSPASWALNSADNWNGGAMHVSHDYGFGLVDAYAAARVAESWRGVSTSANESVASSGVVTLNSPLPDVGSLSSTVTLPAGLRIDHVEIDVALLHSNIGQLEITLASPDGTQSLLFDTPPTSQDDIFFTFSTNQDWGEVSGGDWTLTVSDTQAGASGTLTAWALRAYGDPVGDDTYVYTEEFGALAVADPVRLSLSDAGGTDSINTAAIASDTLLDLRPGSASRIDGQSVTISAGTLVENADSGDGDDVLVGNDAANLLRGWRGNDYLNGQAADDTLDGGAGDDTLDGGQGADVMKGGPGNDLYYAGVGDIIVEEPGGGDSDLVASDLSWTLSANLEQLYLTGSGAISATGNDLANVLYGNGNSAANVLAGGPGDDIYFPGAGDTIVEAPGEGDHDLVVSSISWTLSANVEQLYLTGSGAISATGNDLANVLYGNGNSAANVLAGGPGDDIYFPGAGDTIVEAPGGGDGDLVVSDLSWTLSANVEQLYLTGGAAISATGNDLPNVLYGNGNSAANVLAGGLGDDSYFAGAGDSVVEGAGAGTDTVYTDGDHSLSANVENLYLIVSTAAVLTGNALDNTLHGNAGNDTLNGGLGNDLLTGGAGNDVIRFDSLFDALTNLDTITDFSVTDDTIELENAIFTSLMTTGPLAVDSFRLGTAAVDADDYVIYDSGTGALYYDADGSGTGAPAQFAALGSGLALTNLDFLVT
ncbi:S8 family serine peptidase [Accumulibacter sp.]|uniref:S8 family serine peptidase n=1 Tax=Accumulibacter sp. TaxID=2053492 RepID=UPI0025EABB62|nr:S8 family serine peptidase [Accumulibacter sp.]MCP5229071.1 S8 family serine peptidase [Accumulibacter sp.]